MKPVFFCFCTA